jgi:hypothetical protein
MGHQIVDAYFTSIMLLDVVSYGTHMENGFEIDPVPALHEIVK